MMALGCVVCAPAWAAPSPSTLTETAALTRPAPTAIISPSANGGSVGRNPAGTSPGLIVPVAMPIADEVIVHKAARRLDLMKDGKVLRSYRVELGLVPEGAKHRAGDFRTPEGRYYLVRRNPRSDYFLSIQVSYPDAEDVERAHREHVDPGGSIMIHGRPDILSHPPGYYAKYDWTDGCIALSDSDMVEVWLMTRDNTPIDILP